MELTRVRVAFEDRHVLSKSQRREGLKRCWVLLRPELSTVAALASHIVHSFGLQHSFPGGVVLSMDGYVLPPFESTDIFREKDIIWVRKKGGTLVEPIKIRDDVNLINDSEIVEKQPLLLCDKVLAAEKEIEKESGSYVSEDGEDAFNQPGEAICTENILCETASKRKRGSDELQGSKRKKTKLKSPEKYPVVPTEGSKSITLKQNETCQAKGGSSQESPSGKGMLLNEDDTSDGIDGNGKNMVDSVTREERRKKTKPKGPEKYPVVPTEGAKSITLKQNETCLVKGGSSQESPSRKGMLLNEDATLDGIDGNGKNMVDSVTSEERSEEAHQNGQKNVGEPNVNGGLKKTSSRSARRKKAKRQWRRELANSEKQKLIQSLIPSVEKHQTAVNYDKDQNNDEEEVVPVVIRPGHIRFEPLDTDQSEQQLHNAVETIQWNGTTSKKKGQKWGKERNFKCGTIVDDVVHEQSKEMITAEEGQLETHMTEFEKLLPLTGLPKEGDVVAYRLVELSSSWCPELSSFRVGKVASYDSISMKIILMPVPDYPILSNEDRGEEGSTVQPDDSLYKEDGSLEIDFPSLVNVRIFNSDISHTKISVATSGETNNKSTPIGNRKSNLGARAHNKSNKNLASSVRANNRPNKNPSLPAEANHHPGWDEIGRALDEKKAELIQENGWRSWDTKQSIASPSWSFRALRRSAVGPTVSLLRAKNNLAKAYSPGKLFSKS